MNNKIVAKERSVQTLLLPILGTASGLPAKAMSEGAVHQALEKIAANEQLNAFITVDANTAITKARAADARIAAAKPTGVLEGVVLVVKDNIHVAGMPNTAGTPALKDFVPNDNAGAVQRLVDAGAIILAKTNLHELAFGISSYNPAFSTKGIGVRNAYDVSLIAGGSSGGTAAAIGAGIVAAGLGTDTGGSVRIPAALNGVVGLRPTVGRYPSDGVTPISHTRDTIGPIAADVQSVAFLDGVMADKPIVSEPAKPSDITLGIPKQALANLEPEVEKRFNLAIAKLQKAGVAVVDVDADEIYQLSTIVGFPIAMYEAGIDMRAYLEKYETGGLSIEDLTKAIVSPDVAATYNDLVIPEKLPGAEGLVDAAPVYEMAMTEQRPALVNAYKALFDKHHLDALVFPTTPAVAKPANEASSSLENFLIYIQNTDPGSNAGIPGLSIPMGLTADKLPTGIEIDGLAGQDEKLLSIGFMLERLL